MTKEVLKAWMDDNREQVSFWYVKMADTDMVGEIRTCVEVVRSLDNAYEAMALELANLDD